MSALKPENEEISLSIDEFLNQYRMSDKDKLTMRNTHTTIPNYPRGSGAYHIPPEKIDDFLRVYARDIFEKKESISLTESHHPEVSPILIDLDFRQNVVDNPDSKKFYTQDDIKVYLKEFHRILEKYIDADELKNNEIAYVMEKSKIYNRNKEELKDGIHIVFPKLCPMYKLQFIIRNEMCDSPVIKDLFAKIKTTNDMRAVIDHAVIRNNNWFMYGSCKENNEPYIITHIYDVSSGECVDIPLKTELKNDAKHHFSLLKKLSISNKKVLTPIKNGIEDFVNEKYQNLPEEDKDTSSKITGPNPKKPLQTATTKNLNMDSRKLNKNRVDDKDFELAERLAKECLSTKRATLFEDWIRVCWCLSNIDSRLESAFMEFSKKAAPGKFDEIGCQNEWARSQSRVMESCLGIGTLHKWAIEDNKKKYKEISRDSLSRLMYVSMNKTHTDIASYIYEKFKHEFKCSSIAHSRWYQYKQHRWVYNERGSGLKKKISSDVAKDYIEYAAFCNKKSNEIYGDEPDKETWNKRATTANELSLKLRNTAFCSSVFTQCQEFFFDEKFEEDLDSNDNLLHFLNGIYDLDKNVFREGYPEDNISLSTNINYIEHPDAEDYEKMAYVEDFLTKILPIERVRNYVLTLLASFLHGSNKEQKFHIWTGGGGNGKSMLIDLFKKTLGGYCGSMSSTALTQGRGNSEGASPVLAETRGKKFIALDEAEVGAEIQVGFMRQLTGGDDITARKLNCSPITFRPKFKLVLTCNELPSIPSNEDATWRRIRVVQFISRFCDNPNPKKKYEFPIDRNLQTKLAGWGEVFMYKLIQCYQKGYRIHGIPEPQEVLLNTATYRSNSDIYKQFIEEFLREDPNTTLGIDDVFPIFRGFLTQSGITNTTKYNRREFENRMTKIIGKPNNKKKWKGWKIAPNDEEEKEEEESCAE